MGKSGKINCWQCKTDGFVSSCCHSDYFSCRGRNKCDKCDNYTTVIRCPECKGSGRSHIPNAEIEIDDDDDDDVIFEDYVKDFSE